MCCNSGEDLEVFAPSGNLPHKYTRWNLKISCNFCLFVFFQQGSRHFSFLEEVLKIARQAQNRGRERRRRNARKGKGEEVPFPLSLHFLSLQRRLEVVAWHESSNF